MDAEEEKQKRIFARALLANPRDTMKAASVVFPDPKDVQKKMDAGVGWHFDPFVIDTMNEIRAEEGERTFLPTKEQHARSVLTFAEEMEAKKDYKTALDAHKLYAQIMGEIAKDAPTVNVALENKVMVVPVHTSDEQWEIAAAKQQAALTAHATVN